MLHTLHTSSAIITYKQKHISIFINTLTIVFDTMENIAIDISNELVAKITTTTHHKNVLLVYQKNAAMPELTYGLTSKILNKYKTPLTWICWDEPSSMVKKRLVNFDCDINSTTIIDTVSNLADDDCTVICAPTNFSSIMRNVHKLIKSGEHILVLDNPGKTGIQDDGTTFIKFQSALLNNKNSDVTVITSIESNLLNTRMQQALFSAYDVVLHISKDTIQFKGRTEKKQINYSIKNNKLTLELLFAQNRSRIKDIFDMSPEETDTLDRIVNKQIDVHKEMLI